MIGKFHPHGDQSIYDALVRLAQDFAVRYPLVDGQGNFGNIDGDNAAAMRYTEARMTEVAAPAARRASTRTPSISAPTYDGEEQEPIVLPGAFPNLLANGSSGIAVGMATNIPPHNAAELCDAALHLIKHPERARSRRWSDFVPGPDFPTGGIIVEDRASIARGLQDRPRRLPRARPLDRSRTRAAAPMQVVVTEIPYQVQKARLIEKIAELLEAKQLPLLADVRDECAEDIRVVLEPKSRTVDAGAADGIAVPADRARDAAPAQHERAVARHGAARCMGLGEVLQRMAGAPPRGAASAARASGWRQIATGSRCSTAISSPISTSTR